MTLGRLTFAFISFVYVLLAIPLEERALLERHGASYRHYQSRVRWRLLPGMY
jgi:protein-S-isoprenylcysteine O-methyltransferase Ste14